MNSTFFFTSKSYWTYKYKDDYYFLSNDKKLFLHESIHAMAIEKFNHLVDSYRNTISEWAVCFRYGNFTLTQAYIFEGEEISILETWLIRKSFTFDPSTNGNFEKKISDFSQLIRLLYREKRGL